MKEHGAGFAAQKEEFKGEYQKQVDDMLFFGYRCYMKKNDITQNIPSYPSDDDDIAADDPIQGNGDYATVDSSDG